MKIGSNKLKLVGTTLSIASLAFAAGCDNSDRDLLGLSEQEIIAAQLNGAVIDDRLANATVCSDANNNGQCDNGEASTQSDGNGDYSFFTFAADAVLLALGIPGTTTIAGSGAAITDPIVMRAPPTASVVTPLSTLLVTKIEQSGKELTQANIDAENATLRGLLDLPDGTALESFDYSGETDEAQIKAAVVAQQVIKAVNNVIRTRGINNGQALDPTTVDKNVLDTAFLSLVTTQADNNTTLATIVTLAQSTAKILAANGGKASDASFDETTGALNIVVNGAPIVTGGVFQEGATQPEDVTTVPNSNDIDLVSTDEATTLLEEVTERNQGGSTTTGGTGGTGGTGSGGGGGSSD